jgi:uncharacterized repeat protein (TIGR03803 family)
MKPNAPRDRTISYLPQLKIAALGLTLAGRVRAQTFTTLHSFTALNTNTNSDGSFPYAGISSGNTLYGTANAGGSSGNGTAFKVNTDGTGFTNLHNFNFSDGAYLISGLALAGNTLYGTAAFGGSSSNGTLFKVNTDGTGFANIYSFTATPAPYYTNSDGAQPFAGLILSGNTLYGTATGGGSSDGGTVFKLNTNGTGFTNLHNFAAGSTNSSGAYTNSDGTGPVAGLILSGNTLYGTATSGSGSGNGAVFAINIDGTGFMNLHDFAAGGTNSSGVYTNGDGVGPEASRLILSGNTLYGTASGDGSSGSGTVFSLSLKPQLTIIRSGVPPSGVILTWPTNVAGFSYAGFTLQSTTNLFSPAAWITNSPAPVVVNGQNTVTNPISRTKRFYRLGQ